MFKFGTAQNSKRKRGSWRVGELCVRESDRTIECKTFNFEKVMHLDMKWTAEGQRKQIKTDTANGERETGK